MAYLYKTTNIKNGKYYIGVSSREDERETYLGSGKFLKLAIKKYGKNSFRKEILEEFSSLEEAFTKEAEIVNEDFVNDPETYNCVIGGGGSGPKEFNGVYGKRWKHSDQSKQLMSKLATGENNPRFGKSYSDEEKEQISNRMKEYYSKNPHHASGNIPSEETKNKLKEASKKHYSNRPRKTCPHCNKEFIDMHYGRYHGDRCKMKKEVA
jgi:group I intron endonuclease